MADQPNDVLAEKTVNAFFPTGTVAPKIEFGGQQSVEQMQGGEWVGGKLTVTPQQIEFHANAMNRALVEGNTDRVIPFTDVLNIRQRFGFITGIVDIVVKDGSIFSVRCYGAKQLALILMGGIAIRNINAEQSAAAKK